MDEVITKQKCQKCGHEWWPRDATPAKKCPRCQDDDWREPGKEAKGN